MENESKTNLKIKKEKKKNKPIPPRVHNLSEAQLKQMSMQLPTQNQRNMFVRHCLNKGKHPDQMMAMMQRTLARYRRKRLRELKYGPKQPRTRIQVIRKMAKMLPKKQRKEFRLLILNEDRDPHELLEFMLKSNASQKNEQVAHSGPFSGPSDGPFSGPCSTIKLKEEEGDSLLSSTEHSWYNDGSDEELSGKPEITLFTEPYGYQSDRGIKVECGGQPEGYSSTKQFGYLDCDIKLESSGQHREWPSGEQLGYPQERGYEPQGCSDPSVPAGYQRSSGYETQAIIGGQPRYRDDRCYKPPGRSQPREWSEHAQRRGYANPGHSQSREQSDSQGRGYEHRERSPPREHSEQSWERVREPSGQGQPREHPRLLYRHPERSPSSHRSESRHSQNRPSR